MNNSTTLEAGRIFLITVKVDSNVQIDKKTVFLKASQQLLPIQINRLPLSRQNLDDLAGFQKLGGTEKYHELMNSVAIGIVASVAIIIGFVRIYKNHKNRSQMRLPETRRVVYKPRAREDDRNQELTLSLRPLHD